VKIVDRLPYVCEPEGPGGAVRGPVPGRPGSRSGAGSGRLLQQPDEPTLFFRGYFFFTKTTVEATSVTFISSPSTAKWI